MKTAAAFLLFFLLCTSAMVQAQPAGRLLVSGSAIPPNPDSVDSWLTLANQLNQSGDTSAARYARQTIRMAAALKAWPQAVQATFYLGVSYVNAGNVSAAIQTLESGLRAAQAIRNTRLEIDLGNGLASCYAMNNDFAASLRYFDQTLTLLRKTGELRRYGDVLHNMGSIYTVLKDTAKAIRYLSEADSVSQALAALPATQAHRIEDAISRANNALMLCQAYVEASRFDEATVLALRLMKTAGQLKLDRVKADAYFAMAKVETRPGGDNQKVIRYAAQSMAIDQRLGHDAVTRGESLLTISDAWMEEKDYRRAMDYALQALDFARDYEDKAVEATAWEMLGEQARALGNYRLADSASVIFHHLKDSLNTEDEKLALVRADARLAYQVQATKDSTRQAGERAGMFSAMSRQKKTTGIIFLCVAVAGIATAAGLRYRQRRVRAKEAAVHRRQVAELEQQALRAQMNPHFIFNALNTIDSFVLQNRREDASRLVQRFSRLTRRILEHTSQPVITVQQELETLRTYLQIEQLRKGHAFNFSIEAEPAMLPFAIPPMLLQPFVENAVLHGMQDARDGSGEIRVEVKEEGGAIAIVVEDNGIGRRQAAQRKAAQPETHRSVSMELTLSRLQALHGHKRSEDFLHFIDFEGEATGTRVRMLLPKSTMPATA